MNALYQAIALNNQGAKRFQARDFAASAAAFQQSATLLREFSRAQLQSCESACSSDDLMQLDENSGTTGFSSYGWVLCFDECTTTEDNERICTSPLEVYDPADDVAASSYYLHAAPLVLCAESGGTKVIVRRDDVHDIVLATTCSTLFNLALSHHMLGNNTRGNSSNWIKAAKLYDSVWAILDNRTHGASCTSSSSRTTLYATVACLVLNNRAHLHMELDGDYPSCVSCAHDVRDLLLVLDPVDLSIVGMDTNVVDEIGLNCMRLLSLSAASAA